MNPFYQRFQQNQNGNNPFASPMAFQQAASQMMNSLAQIGMTPQARVSQLIQSGQMTQQQFNQFAQIANQLTGRRY